MAERIILPSGIEIIFKDFKNLRSASVGVWINKGARNEPANCKGIAHFLEHLLFKGSRFYNHKQIKQEIEGRGGQLNGFTSQEVTCFFADVLNTHLPIAVDVLADVVVFPLLKKDDIEKERGVVLEEMRMYKDIPSSRVSDLLNFLLWKKHALGVDVLGKEETVKRITKRDILSFHSRSYTPGNIKVVICSSELSEEIKNNIAGKFSKCKKGLRKWPSRKARISKGFDFLQEVSSFAQTHLSLGFPGLKFGDQRRTALGLLHVILGANMSSRLFESLREEKGLVYEVSSGISKYKDTGSFHVHCGLETKNTGLAFKTIMKELKRIKDKNIGKKELVRAKDYYLGNLYMMFDSPARTMAYIGESVCRGSRVRPVKEIEQKVNKVQVDDIKHIARQILNFNDLKIAVVTNKKESFLPVIKNVLKKI